VSGHGVQLRLYRTTRVVVSCQCLGRREHIGETVTYDDTRRLYNDPGNHRLPFDPVVEGLRPWWHRWGSPAAAAWPGVTA
jgi:hypothetical protein